MKGKYQDRIKELYEQIESREIQDKNFFIRDFDGSGLVLIFMQQEWIWIQEMLNLLKAYYVADLKTVVVTCMSEEDHHMEQSVVSCKKFADILEKWLQKNTCIENWEKVSEKLIRFKEYIQYDSLAKTCYEDYLRKIIKGK